MIKIICFLPSISKREKNRIDMIQANDFAVQRLFWNSHILVKNGIFLF